MRILGSVATAATTRVPVYDKTYNEPTSGAQRSIKSASANDAAAGSGARTVKITYYALAAGVITGPFTETLTLNGVTAVPTVATNIALIERIDVLTAGSGGVAAGDISLYAAADGTGTVIAILASGGVRTYLGHHYVPTNGQCVVHDLAATGGDTGVALVELDVKQYAATAQVELPVEGLDGVTSAMARQVDFPGNSLRVIGPCRVRALVTPSSANQTTRVSFGYRDEIVR